MKRQGNLFEAMCSFQNLHKAFKKALRGSGKSEGACEFSFHLESNLLTLEQELLKGVYIPGRYRYFKVFEPKERVISVAPFRDRVVHHAVINILEPIFDKTFIYDSYATRKGKGTHRAVKRAQNFLKQTDFYLKFDIDKYFDHISHEIMFNLLARKIKDQNLLELLKVIMATSDKSRGTEMGKGLPIGNLTSQFFANVYLDWFDHFIKEDLRIKRYIRYMDDCLIFSEDKYQLIDVLKKADAFLKNKLGLNLKQKATCINTRQNGLSFLGYRLFPSLIRLKRENLKRVKRKLSLRKKQFEQGIIPENRYIMSLQSLAGYVCFADSFNLRQDLFGLKGTGQRAAGVG